MANTSTAFWVDTKAKIPAMSSMLQQAATKSPPELVTIVVYNVPNRDCASNNSVGDICCYYYPDGSCNREKDGDCSAGLADYDTNFIAPIAAELAKYEGKMPIVLIIEPDSLPNIATNQGVAACASTATQAAYTKGIQYAITTISQKAPSVTMYLDAAHGNWVRASRTATHARRALIASRSPFPQLGWANHMQSFAAVLKGLQVETMIRGFATSVSNYQPFGAPCSSGAFSIDGEGHVTLNCAGDACCDDPCNVLSGTGEQRVQLRAGALDGGDAVDALVLAQVRHRHQPLRPPRRARRLRELVQPRGDGGGPPAHRPHRQLRPRRRCPLDQAARRERWMRAVAGAVHRAVDADRVQAPRPRLHRPRNCAPPRARPDYGAKMLAENANFNGAKDTSTHPLVSSPFQPCGGRPCARGYTCGGIGLCVPTAATLSTFKGDVVVTSRAAASRGRRERERSVSERRDSNVRGGSTRILCARTRRRSSALRRRSSSPLTPPRRAPAATPAS